MMRKKNALYLGMTAVGVAGFLAAYPLNLSAQNTVAIDADDIGGVVTSSKGPEAGVWVIAETTDLGNKATRTIPETLGKFANGYEAWTRRIQSGQASSNMVNNINRLGAQGALKMLGDWTDRIAAGELPASKPRRPEGIERNAVVTT